MGKHDSDISHLDDPTPISSWPSSGTRVSASLQSFVALPRRGAHPNHYSARLIGATPVSRHPNIQKSIVLPSVTSTFSHVQPGNKLKYAWTVEMLEVDLYALDLSPEGRAWPRDVVYPSGVVMCYDAQAKQSLRGFEQAVREY